MYIGIGTIVLIVIIVLVVLMLRRLCAGRLVLDRHCEHLPGWPYRCQLRR